MSEFEFGDISWLAKEVVISNDNSSEFRFKFKSSKGSAEGNGTPAVAFVIKCNAFRRKNSSILQTNNFIRKFLIEINENNNIFNKNNIPY